MQKHRYVHVVVLATALLGACAEPRDLREMRAGAIASVPRLPTLNGETVPPAASTAGAVQAAGSSNNPPAKPSQGAPPATTCVHPRFQPDLCIPAEGPLEGSAVDKWFTDRGAKVPSLGLEPHCSVTSFGRFPEALLCINSSFELGPMGGDGPLGTRRWLRLLVVREKDKRVVELGKLPLGIAESNSWGADALFYADYKVDATQGAVTLMASATDCKAGQQGVREHHETWMKEAPNPIYVRARKAQIRLDSAFAVKICAAAGRYELNKNGKLVRLK